MNFLKLGFALSLVATFGIVACDESSSADDNKSNDPNTISCKVTEQNPLVIETTRGDISITSTTKLSEGTLTQVMEFNKDVPEKDCKEQKEKLSDHFKVECKGKTITAVSTDKMDTVGFDVYAGLLTQECKAIDGEKIDKEDVKKALDCEEEGAVRDTVVAGVKGSATCKNGKWVLKEVKADPAKTDETATDDADDVESDTNTGDDGAANDEGAAAGEE